MMKTNISFMAKVIVFFRSTKYQPLKKEAPSASARTAMLALLVYSTAHFFHVAVLQAGIPPRYYTGMAKLPLSDWDSLE